MLGPPAAHQAKAAGIAAEIKQGFIGGHVKQVSAIFTLVAEEAGFMAGFKVNDEKHAIFLDHRPVGAIRRAKFLRVGALSAGSTFIEPDNPVLCAKLFLHDFKQRPDTMKHAETEAFYRKGLVEAVNDEARKAVALGMHGTISRAIDFITNLGFTSDNI
jgi:hypothetical protein